MPRSASTLIVTAVLACCLALLPDTAVAQQGRPRVRFTTDAAFDASRIPAYAGRHEEVYRHIDAPVSEPLTGDQIIARPGFRP